MEDLLTEVSDEQLAKVLEVSLKQFLSERIAKYQNSLYLQERLKKKRDRVAELRRAAAELQKEASKEEKEVVPLEEAMKPGPSGQEAVGQPGRRWQPTARSADWRKTKGKNACNPYKPPKGPRGPKRGPPGGKSFGGGVIQIGSGRPIVYMKAGK